MQAGAATSLWRLRNLDLVFKEMEHPGLLAWIATIAGTSQLQSVKLSATEDIGGTISGPIFQDLVKLYPSLREISIWPYLMEPGEFRHIEEHFHGVELMGFAVTDDGWIQVRIF